MRRSGEKLRYCAMNVGGVYVVNAAFIHHSPALLHNSGIAEEVAFEKQKFKLVMKLNRNTKVQHLQVSHFFGNTLLCVRSFYYLCNRKFFTLRYLRAVGHQWLRPDDSLPCFFINTVDKGWNARNTMCPVESPMQGNNWRPTQPDGVERHTFFPFNLLSIIRCRFRMTHNVMRAYEVLLPDLKRQTI